MSNGSRLPQPSENLVAWPMVADFLRANNKLENIKITHDTTNIYVESGTYFYIYEPVTYTISTSTNGAYSGAVSDINGSQFIFEPAQSDPITTTLAADTTYYLRCDSVSSTDRFKGVYSVGTTAPNWDDQRIGWYDSGVKIIAGFTTDGSSNITTVWTYDSMTNDQGLYGLNFDVVSNVLQVSGRVEIDKKVIDHITPYKVDITGLAASTWYGVYIDETTGVMGNDTIDNLATADTGSWAPNTANNQLDMYTLYDSEKNYCLTTDSKRIVYIYKTDSTPSNLLQNKKIEREPETFIVAYSTLTQNNTSRTPITCENIDIDVNSEYDNTTNYDYTACRNKTIEISVELFDITYFTTVSRYFYLHDGLTATDIYVYRMQPPGASDVPFNALHNVTLQKNQVIRWDTDNGGTSAVINIPVGGTKSKTIHISEV